MTIEPATWQPQGADQNLSQHTIIPPSTQELRKRSLPPYIIEAQKKEALEMVTEQEVSEEGLLNQAQPSLLKRHFYRPVQKNDGNNDSDNDSSTTIYRFSFLSRGFLTLAGLLCFILIVVLCAVLATVYQHHQHKAEVMRTSPIKRAVYANFPDPFIIHHEDTWYAMATNNAAGILSQPHDQTTSGYGASNVQLATSTNFGNWSLLNVTHDPLPVVGDWAKTNYSDTNPSVPLANVWAPAVIQRPSDNKFILYYSAAVKTAKRSHCVGAAISNTTSPAGPYVPLNETIACPIEAGGAIDPAPFIDVDGTMWLAWKVDGNNAGHGGVCGNTVPPLTPTPIRLQKMASDGVTRDGEATTILDRTDADGPLVEAPALVRTDEGIYFLFFSSGCTRTPSYDIKYAWAHNITGPYTRAEYPLLKTGDWDLMAPGSVDVARTSNGTYEMAFHARVVTPYGKPRAMFTSPIAFNGTLVTIGKNE